MRHLARYLALTVCLALTGSAADAAPTKHVGRHAKAGKMKVKHRAKPAPTVDERAARDEDRSDDEEEDDVAMADDDADDDDAEAEDAEEEAPPRRHADRKGRKKAARAARTREEDETDSDRVAFARDAEGDASGKTNDARDTVDDDDEVLDAPVKLHKVAAARANDWHVAIGPYLWASSVDAKVSLGSESVSTGIDFFEMSRHARYGAEVLAEARYRRFSIAGDLMYGVVDVNGMREIGPLMVTIDGTASSLLVDGIAGYRFLGDDRSLLSLEARSGVRYQRTAVAGSVGVGGNPGTSLASIDAGGDMVAGGRVSVRPFSRFSVSGNVDHSLFGSSNSTWSASADACVRVTSHVLVSAGWRTLTSDRAFVTVVMHGPRAAVQLLF